MNGRQAAKAAAKRIEELEHVNRLCTLDIKGYVACIYHMIHGGSPCEFCADLEECQLKAKEEGKGCDEWMLTFELQKEVKPDDSNSDPVPGVQVNELQGSEQL